MRQQRDLSIDPSRELWKGTAGCEDPPTVLHEHTATGSYYYLQSYLRVYEGLIH